MYLGAYHFDGEVEPLGEVSSAYVREAVAR